MDQELDSLLIATEKINERIRLHRTDPTTELANSVHVLPLDKQKRVEDFVNTIYAEMKSDERAQCLQKWDNINDRIVTFTLHGAKHQCCKNVLVAAKMLWKHCQGKPIRIIDWIPEENFRYIYSLNIRPFILQRKGDIARHPYNHDIVKKFGNIFPIGPLNDSQMDIILGPKYDNPTLQMCIEWIRKAPIIILDGYYGIGVTFEPTHTVLV